MVMSLNQFCQENSLMSNKVFFCIHLQIEIFLWMTSLSCFHFLSKLAYIIDFRKTKFEEITFKKMRTAQGKSERLWNISLTKELSVFLFDCDHRLKFLYTFAWGQCKRKIAGMTVFTPAVKTVPQSPNTRDLGGYSCGGISDLVWF